MGEVRVIGVGNPLRGDDGVGPVVATRLSATVGSGLEVLVSSAEPSRLMEIWEGADSVVIVDAVVDGNPGGTVTVLDAIADHLPADLASLSSHGLGVGAAVELARSLGRLPADLTVVGVSAEHFEGDGLTDVVADAVPVAVNRVMEVVGNA